MKRACVAAVVCMAVGSSMCLAQRASASNTRQLAAPRLSSILDLRRLRLPGIPVRIEMASSAGSTDDSTANGGTDDATQSSPTASRAYKTGTGVAMRSYAMRDTATSSYADANFVQVGFRTVDAIVSHADSPPLYIGIPITMTSACAAFGIFASIPLGDHTYMFSLGATPDGDTASRMKITLGNQVLGPDKVLYSNGAFRVVFTYDSGPAGNQKRLTYRVNVDCTNSSAGLSFYYAQLAQLD